MLCNVCKAISLSVYNLTDMQSLPQGENLAESAQVGKDASPQPDAVSCNTFRRMWDCKDVQIFELYECNITFFTYKMLTFKQR